MEIGQRIALAENNMAEAKEQVKGAVVHLDMGSVSGSGVIYHKEEDALYIVTNAHALSYWEDESSFIDMPYGYSVMANKLTVWEAYDIGFLRVDKTSFTQSQWEVLREIDCMEYEDCAIGDYIFALGTEQTEKENLLVSHMFYTGTIADSALEQEEYDCALLYLYIYVKPGMSGGGIFSEDGKLLGIISAGSDSQEALAIPINIVEKCFLEL